MIAGSPYYREALALAIGLEPQGEPLLRARLHDGAVGLAVEDERSAVGRIDEIDRRQRNLARQGNSRHLRRSARGRIEDNVGDEPPESDRVPEKRARGEATCGPEKRSAIAPPAWDEAGGLRGSRPQGFAIALSFDRRRGHCRPRPRWNHEDSVRSGCSGGKAALGRVSGAAPISTGFAMAPVAAPRLLRARAFGHEVPWQ